MKKKYWNIICLSLGVMLLTTSFQNTKYPAITLSVNIFDKETKQVVKGADFKIVMNYQTQKCLPWGREPFAPYSKTISFKMPSHVPVMALRNFVKSYEVTVQHLDYQPWSVSDSSDMCKNIILEIGLEKKK